MASEVINPFTRCPISAARIAVSFASPFATAIIGRYCVGGVVGVNAIDDADRSGVGTRPLASPDGARGGTCDVRAVIT